MTSEQEPLLSPPQQHQTTTSSSAQISRSSEQSSSSRGTTERFAMALWTVGCLYGASSVMLGAFGAHGLKKRIADPSKLASWDTAAKYQAFHSCATLITAIAAPRNKLAGGLFIAGMTMFSGSIYLLVLDPQRFKALGPVTPLGGLCLIGGWLALGFGPRRIIV